MLRDATNSFWCKFKSFLKQISLMNSNLCLQSAFTWYAFGQSEQWLSCFSEWLFSSELFELSLLVSDSEWMFCPEPADISCGPNRRDFLCLSLTLVLHGLSLDCLLSSLEDEAFLFLAWGGGDGELLYDLSFLGVSCNLSSRETRLVLVLDLSGDEYVGLLVMNWLSVSPLK